MRKKIQLYHYGDCGSYDSYNPFTIFNRPFVPELLYLIAKSSNDKRTILNSLPIDENTLNEYIETMNELNMVSEVNGKIFLNFTVILDEDLEEIKAYSISVANSITNLIIENQSRIHEIAQNFTCRNRFDLDRILYHVIGCEIFDGTAMDALTSKKLIMTSKEQPGNRNYILFGFEDTPTVDEFSKALLCSCNSVVTEKASFISFGDANGYRNDLYRCNRQMIQGIANVSTRTDTKDSFLKIFERKINEASSLYANLINRIFLGENRLDCFSEEEIFYLKFLKAIDYIHIENNNVDIIVPVFTNEDKSTIESLHLYLMEILLPKLESHFTEFRDNISITAMRHNIEPSECFNEIWHQIFGNINKNLIEKGFLKKPDYYDGEGRYLKAIHIN